MKKASVVGYVELTYHNAVNKAVKGTVMKRKYVQRALTTNLGKELREAYKIKYPVVS